VRPTSTRLLRGMLTPEIRAIALALSLLVTRVRADDEHPAVAADDLAFFAHRFDRGSYFHARLLTLECFRSSFGAALANASDRRYRTEARAAHRSRCGRNGSC
jgi:hypothetical protein